MTEGATRGWGRHATDLQSDPEAQILEIARRSSSARQSVIDARGLGVVHLLVLIDVLAWCLSVVTTIGRPGIGAFVLLGLILWLNAVGGLYQPKLSLSALDDAASLAGRALVAGALVTSVRLVAGEAMGTRLLHMAMVIAALSIVFGRAVGYTTLVPGRRRAAWWRTPR